MSYFRRFSERTTLNATASTLSLALLRILLAQYMLMSMPQKLSIFLHGFSIPQFVAFAIATALATSMLLGHYSRTCTFLIGATAAVLYYNQSYGWPTLPFGVKDFSSHTVQRDLIYSAYLGLMLSFTPCGAVLSLDAIHDSKAAQGGGPIGLACYFRHANTSHHRLFLDSSFEMQFRLPQRNRDSDHFNQKLSRLVLQLGSSNRNACPSKNGLNLYGRV